MVDLLKKARAKRYYQRHADRIKTKSSAYYHKNQEKCIATGIRYVAKNRTITKARKDAWYRANRERILLDREKYYLQNLAVIKVKAKKYRTKNAEKKRATDAAWRKKNPDRVRITGRVRAHRRRERIACSKEKLTVADIEKLRKLQKNKCACCKRPLTDKFHVDHIIALANGGQHNFLNTQLLCKPCNMAKSAKHPIAFMQERGFLL